METTINVPGRRPSPVNSRSLLPKEHGAWVELGLPLLTALVAARPTPAGLAFACSACAAFFAHEPWLVLRGLRGSRAQRENGERARRMFFGLLALMGVSGGVALALTGKLGLELAVLPAVLSIGVAVLVHRGEERTLFGESVAGAALSSFALPVAVADGVDVPRALAMVGAWTAIFAVGTAVVRGLVAKVGRRNALPPLAVFLGAAVLYLSGTIALAPFAAIVPACVATFVVALAAPPPQKLKRVGYTMAAAHLVSAALLVAL